MLTRLAGSSIAAAAAACAVVLGGCGASAASPSPNAPSPSTVARTVTSPSPPPSLAPTPSPSSSIATPIDGTWKVAFSRDEMLAVGIVDKGEDDGSNYGSFTLTFENGSYHLTQLTEPYIRDTGSFQVRGSQFVYTNGAGEGPFACAFELGSDTLAFPTVLDAAGKIGDGNCTMPFRVKPWRRVSGPTSASPSTAPAPSLAVLPKGQAAAGTYATTFEPGLTITLDRPAENDADTPTSWIDLVFEGDPNQDLQVVRLDKVIDPRHGNRAIDPPADLAGWIARLPGLTAIAPARAVTVGGLDATQLDLKTGQQGVLIAPIPGIDYSSGYSGMPAVGQGEGDKDFRMIVVRVHGIPVVIASFADGDDHGSHFKAVTEANQPVIDSIEWR